jgi:hypothetical protein
MKRKLITNQLQNRMGIETIKLSIVYTNKLNTKECVLFIKHLKHLIIHI